MPQISGPWPRPLIPITLAVIAGLTAAAWGVQVPALGLLGGGVVIWLVLLVFWWRQQAARFLPLLFFWLFGVAWYHQALNPVLPAGHVAHLPLDTEISLLGHIEEPPLVQGERVRLTLKVEAWRSPEGWRPAGGYLLLRGAAPPAPPEGARILFQARLYAPHDLNNPGAFAWRRYLAAQEIYREARLTQPGSLMILALQEPLSFRHRLRNTFRGLLEQLPPLPRSLYLSLILGDQREITPEMRQAFGRTGTTHILSISGLHLGMLTGVSFLAFFWLLRRFPWLLLRLNAVKVATLLAALPMLAYAWVAESSPATQRSEIMILAYLLLVLLGRAREVPSALALAAFMILTMSPLRLFSLSFQLSFLSLGALLYFLPRWLPAGVQEAEADAHPRGWPRRVFDWLLGGLLACLAATMATAPLVAAAFHQVSLAGVVVNLAAIPLLNTLAVPVGLLALAAQVVQLEPLAYGLLYLGQAPLWLGYQAIHWGSLLPGAAITLPSPDWLQITAFWVLLILVFPPHRNALTWGGAALAGLLLAVSVTWPFLAPPQDLEITCLDSPVGLDGVIVAPPHHRLAFSAAWETWPGKPARAGGPLPSYLYWRQWRRLDTVLALRLNQGNAAELLTIVQELSLGEFFYGGYGGKGPAYLALLNTLGDQRKPARRVRVGQPPLSLGDARLNLLQIQDGKALALHLNYQGRQVLLLPPLGRAAKAELPAIPGPLEVLVTASEGSHLLVAQMQPRHLILYGRPPSPAATAADCRLPVLATRDGTVTIRIARDGTTLSQWRP